jgi:hypothetical protein
VVVPGDDPADPALRVEAERGVGVVHLLTAAPRGAAPGGVLSGDLRVLPGEPGRHRVRRSAEDYGDAAFVGAVEDGLQ